MSEGRSQVDAARTRSAEGAQFYRYTDDGRVVIVDDLSRIPARLRDSAESIRFERPSTVSLPALRELPERVHWASFLAGASVALVVTLAVLALRRRVHGLMRWAIALGVLALGAGAYFGWLRRMGGQSEQLLGSPQSLIEDARAAVERMNERTRAQQQELRELETQR
jgi:hypothetical protein